MAEEGTMEKLCPYLFGTCVKHNLFMNFDIQLLYHKKIMYLKMLLIQLDPVLSGNSVCEEILVYPLLVTFSRFIHFHVKTINVIYVCYVLPVYKTRWPTIVMFEKDLVLT